MLLSNLELINRIIRMEILLENHVLEIVCDIEVNLLNVVDYFVVILCDVSFGKKFYI